MVAQRRKALERVRFPLGLLVFSFHGLLIEGFNMIRFLVLVLVALSSSVAMADGPILLVTPKGVFQSTVTNGIPGPWAPHQIDVIVQGFGGGNTPPVPPVSPDDPIVASVAAVSKSLKDVKEATAVAAIITSLVKAGVKPADMKEALSLSGNIADTALKADGRIVKWVASVTVITSDPDKLKAGLILAWNIPSSSVDAIYAAASQPIGTTITGEAIDFAKIIEIIQMIIALLKSLGII